MSVQPTPGARPAAVHLLTGEYPPQFGGVSDYSHGVARGLAARGIPVHVWCPPADGDDAGSVLPGVTVHRIAGTWSRADFARLDDAMDRTPAPRRLIVQWVPHAFGHRSLNVPFCAWVRRRAGAGDTVDVMVHEACFAFGEGGWKQDAAAVVHRLMVSLLMSRARHVWVSIPAWADVLRPFTFGRSLGFDWLPVPSNVTRVDDDAAVASVRACVASENAVVVGHFGTYESHVRRTIDALTHGLLARDPRVVVLLMGRDSDRVARALVDADPSLAGRVSGTGRLDASALSTTLQACDLVVQPYPDGASSRRGTLMAALSHGVPVVTTDGRLSEPIWRESGAVRLVPAGDPDALLEAVAALCGDASDRTRLAREGRALYEARFDITYTLRALEREPRTAGPTAADAPARAN